MIQENKYFPNRQYILKAAGWLFLFSFALGLAWPAQAEVQENYQNARQLFEKRQYKKSADIYKTLAEKYPDHKLMPNFLFWRGECLYGLTDYQEALKLFEKVVHDFPKSFKAPDSVLKIAYTLKRLNKNKLAVDSLKEVIKKYPKTRAAKIAENKIPQWKPPEKKVLTAKKAEVKPQPEKVEKKTAAPSKPVVKPTAVRKPKPAPIKKPAVKKKSEPLPERRAAVAVLGEEALLTEEEKEKRYLSRIKKSITVPKKKTVDYAAVFTAIKTNNREKLREMLDKYEFIIELRDNQGYTPLHTAARFNRSEMIKLLLAKGADVNADSGNYIYKFTPLHVAAKYNSLEAARLLIDHNADPDAGKYIRRKEWTDRYALTPLFAAVNSKRIQMVRMLLDLGADPNISAHPAIGETPLRLAGKKGYAEIAVLLRQYGAIH